MQTSSNFFTKNLFSLEDQKIHTKKFDKYHQTHIVPDPLRLKQQLTPWTQINPKYNFNTQRLVKFKLKINQQQKAQNINEQVKEVKQIKPQMVSNLFNFYKNNKQKKRSTLNNSKRKNKNNQILDQTNIGWTLPSIDDKQQLQEDLLNSKQSKQSNQNKQDKQKIEDKSDKKHKQSNFIQSISIRQYLMKLKQKERIFSSHQTIDKTNSNNKQSQQFTSNRSNRYSKNKPKGVLTNSISTIRQFAQQDIHHRYGPIRNPQSQTYKKRQNLSPLQSLQQSFEIYKRAAEQQVHQNLGGRKILDKYTTKGGNISIVDKQYWRNNVPLSSLFSSPNLETIKSPGVVSQSISPIKKYNTISYDRSFSPTNNSLQLPKIAKNFSHHQ